MTDNRLNDPIDWEILNCVRALKKRNIDIPIDEKYDGAVAYYEKFRMEIFHNGDNMVDAVEVGNGDVHCSPLDMYIQAKEKERTDHDSICLLHGKKCPFFYLILNFDYSKGKNNATSLYFNEEMWFSLHKQYECTPICKFSHIEILIRDVNNKLLLKCRFGKIYSEKPDLHIHVFVNRSYISFQMNWLDGQWPPRLRWFKRKAWWEKFRKKNRNVKSLWDGNHCSANMYCVKNISFLH